MRTIILFAIGLFVSSLGLAQQPALSRYDSTKESKAKGIRFSIDYPPSWLAQPGDRPNIVQRFTSESGRGLDVVTILIKDLDLPADYVASPEEIDELYSLDSLSAMLPSGATVISTSQTKIDGSKCGYVYFLAPFERANLEMLTKSEMYVLYHRRKLVMISLMVGVPKTDGAGPVLAKRFAGVQPVFQKMVASVVLLDKWK